MTQYHTLNVKLSNSQLNNFEISNKKLELNNFTSFINKLFWFPHKSLLTNT